jgi:hypothetical protein
MKIEDGSVAEDIRNAKGSPWLDVLVQLLELFSGHKVEYVGVSVSSPVAYVREQGFRSSFGTGLLWFESQQTQNIYYPKRPDWCWGPPALLLSWYGAVVPSLFFTCVPLGSLFP